VQLISLRAFGRDGRGDDDDIAQAVIYAAENNISVLNLSFGDTHISPLMHEAIRYAVDSGVVVIASAGNVGGDAPHYPSDYPEVISVAWLSGDGLGLASRATSGVGVDIGAPGSSVFTTTLPQDSENESTADFYGRRSGSSMAAPMVSATAALIRSVGPSLTPASVRSAVTSTAVDVQEPGWDHDTGAGLLNVSAAVLRALPARVEITAPLDDQGFAIGPIEVQGSAVDPSFLSYQLFYARGDQDLTSQSWIPIEQVRYEQVYNGALGSWDVSRLYEGVYTLRLSVLLRTGRAIDERRRVHIDGSEPAVHVHLLDAALVDGYHGIIGDIETDDLADLEMVVAVGEVSRTVESSRRARRHGLFWADHTLTGGTATVSVHVTNVAGLRRDTVLTIMVPPYRTDSALLNVSSSVGPDGFLLDALTDFDGDGLREVVLNVYEDGWIGDTLAILEWDGFTFRRAATAIAGVIPRATGDSDGDGLIEVLTQIGPATFLLEQSLGSYPDQVAFADTSGLSGGAGDSFWGGLLADLDADGRGEIVGHNTRAWRIMEWNGTSYEEVARLENPTSVSDSELGENTFEQPYAMIGDLDGDGKRDMLVGDSDGDWIIYEAVGDNTVLPVWSHETNRYDAGSRFAVGDLDGNGIDEVVVYDHNWLTTTVDGEREPDVGRYTIIRTTGDDQYEVAESFLVSGEISRHGSMAIFDATGDDVDDLVLVNPPDLYVVSFDASMAWGVVYHQGLGAPQGGEGYRSIRMVVGDVDSDGEHEVIVADAGGSIRVIGQSGTDTPAPAWMGVYAIDEISAQLAWHSFGADSVAVYRAPTGGAFESVAVTAASTLIDSVTVTSEYALRGWFGGTLGPMSRSERVRPHRPAVVSAIARLSSARLEVTFTEPLDQKIRAEQFALDAGGTAGSLMLASQGRTALLDFPDASRSADTLRWSGIVDSEGTPVGERTVYVAAVDPQDRSLIIQSWSVQGPSRLKLTFSEPVLPESAELLSNYRLDPHGEVVTAMVEPDRPDEVVLEIRGAAIGATGLESSLTVVNIVAANGAQLAPEGNTIRLSGAADDLSSVYLFPNPYRRSVDDRGVMVAGLPSTASVEVYSSDGVLIRRLEETNGDGGVRWDTRDTSGATVPSGVYLVLVRAGGQGSVLKKAAIIH
jgi:hypothetical protein